MDYRNLCMGCMRDKGSEDLACSVCGFIEGAAPESPLFLQPRTILENKYLIGRVLGQGGFGITYLAWDINLNIKLAIKEYFPQDLATRASGHTQVSAYSGSMGSQYEYGLDKFLQEARTLAQFEEHPNIVSVRDFFKDNGTAYFVMSYVEGITLKDHLARSGGKLPVDQARSIMMPVLDALKEVHAVNVLHRDVSPDNIFINNKGQVILIDFGAARQAIGEKGQSLSIILKPGYAPEEQYRSKGMQGPWTDIYAAAATYYHLIVGHQPPEALERMVEDELILPIQAGAQLSAEEESAILVALAVRAGDRYQSVADFQRGLVGEKPLETPAAPLPRSSRRTEAKGIGSKIKGLPIAVLTASGLLVVALIIGIVLWSGGVPGGGSTADSGALKEGPQVINPVGNTPGNIVNSGLAAVQGEKLYYRSNEGGSLYEADLSEGGTSILSTDSAWFINVAGDWIYYSNRDDNNRIYRVGTDGSGRAPVTRSRALFVTLADGWLYYLDQDEENRIYKVTTEGGERTLLSEDSAWALNLADNWIYYINRDDNNRIYRVAIDGSDREQISADSSCCLSFNGEWLYFSNESDRFRLYRMQPDGSEQQVLNDQPSRFVNASGEWIYYANEADGYTLSRIKPDGSEAETLAPAAVKDINFAGNSLVYFDQVDENTVYRVELDGTNRELVEIGF